jgi:Cys-rich repeat protein
MDSMCEIDCSSCADWHCLDHGTWTECVECIEDGHCTGGQICDAWYECADLPPSCGAGGETCAAAAEITSSCEQTGLDSTAFANDYSPTTSSCTGYSQALGPDMVWSVWLDAGDQIAVVQDSTAPYFDAVLYLVADCGDIDGSCVAGSDSGDPESIDHTAETSGTYYIIADGFAAVSYGGFDIAVEITAGGDADTDTDTDTDTQTDTDSETATDTDTDSGTDTDTDTDSCTDVAFFEDFSGSTVFSEVDYPFGEPSNCVHSDEVNFSNTGTEHLIQCGCYDEAELTVSAGLPADDYRITVKWRSGADPMSYDDCEFTFFDEQYGADCVVPTRLIVVDGAAVHEVSGQLGDHSEISSVSYSGSIGTLALAFGTSGMEDDYNTWYDFVEICRQ